MKYKGGRDPVKIKDKVTRTDSVQNKKQKSNFKIILSYLKSHHSEPKSDQIKYKLETTNINTYYDFYRAVNINKTKSKRKKQSNVKVISCSQFKEKILLEDLYVKNKLDTFFSDNIDIIENINKYINIDNLKTNQLSPIKEDSAKYANIERLSPIKEGSSENRSSSRKNIKGGGKLTSLGDSFLSILHILDRKHDFASVSSPKVKDYIVETAIKNIETLLGVNSKFKNEMLKMYSNSGMEKKILIYTIDKIIDGSYIENTDSYVNFSFIDRGENDDLDVYNLKTKRSPINYGSIIDEHQKIAKIIKDFFKYSDNTNKYIYDINLTHTFSTDLHDAFYRELGEQLFPYENAFDPHSSEKIEVPIGYESIYEGITNSNFNVFEVQEYLSAIRNKTRDYLGFEYYNSITYNKYYPAIYFKDNIINDVDIKIFYDIIQKSAGGDYYEEINSNLFIYYKSSIKRLGFYYVKSFNNVSNIKEIIDTLLTIKENNNINNGMINKYKKSTTIEELKKKKSNDALFYLLITYLYYSYANKATNLLDDIECGNIITNIIDILFDLKKAGDWSQALFCSKYNNLPSISTRKDCFFVSGDFLASIRSIMSTNVKNLFTADYKTINSTSEIKENNMIGLFKNMENITYKELSNIIIQNIFSEEFYNQYANIIKPELFFDISKRSTSKIFTENDIIIQEEFNSINFSRLLKTICYIFITYLADNTLITFNKPDKKSNIIKIPYPRDIPLESLVLADILTSDEYIQKMTILKKESKRGNLSILFDSYIQDILYTNDTIITFNITELNKIIIHISNVNKLYNILLCNQNNEEMRKNNISKIKEIFHVNSETILEFIKNFNVIYTSDIRLKKEIGAHYIHKSLYEEYINHSNYTSIIEKLNAIKDEIKPSKQDTFIIKFRNKYNIDADETNKNKIVDALKHHFIVNPISSQPPEKVKDLTKIYTSINKSKSKITIDSLTYELYVKEVLIGINKTNMTQKGIILYDNYIKDHEQNLTSIKAIANNISYSIKELLEIINKAATESFAKYEELYKILENVYNTDNPTHDKYILKSDDISRLPILSENITRTNDLFSNIPSMIPAPPAPPAPPAQMDVDAHPSNSRKRPFSSAVLVVRSTLKLRQRANKVEKEVVIDKKKFLEFYNAIIKYNKGSIYNIYDDRGEIFNLLPSFLKTIKYEEENDKTTETEKLNIMLKNICLLTYMAQNLSAIQNPVKTLNDLSRTFNGNYKIIELIKLSKNSIKSDLDNNYFFGPDTKLVRLLQSYLKYMVDDVITNYITNVKIKTNYGLNMIFKKTTNYETLNILSNQLDILVKFAGGMERVEKSKKSKA